MVATKHIRPHPLAPRSGARARSGAGATYAIERLLEQAGALGLRAPELTMVLGERAAALAETAGSGELWVRAESLVVSARVRLGLRAVTVARAVAALRAAEDLGDTVLAAGLRTDLAVCARSVGVPLTGLAALRPVLELPDFSGAAKAAALCHLVGCLSQFGRKHELDRTFTEADRLCGADAALDGDARLLARALMRVGMSSHRRRHGDVLGAADAARTGLGLLDQLDDPRRDGGVVRIRLVLQLVCSVLDRGDTGNAMEIAQPLLDEPVRAASVAPAGWLRLAVATRILLPSGAVEAAASVLREGVHGTERHGLHALTAQLWFELSHVEDRLGRPSEAIECLHRGRAAEHVHARARRQAVGLLSGEFGNGGHAEVDLDEVLGSAPGGGPGTQSGTQSEQCAPAVVIQPVAKPATAERRTESPTARSGLSKPVVAGVTGAPVAVVRPETPDRAAQPVKPVKPVQTAVPDLPLAPAPAEEPPPRASLVARPPAKPVPEPEPEAEREPVPEPEAPAVAKESRAERRAREESVAKVKTRHDSEHGSVAARSVLDRLGVTTGMGGGRRRAEREGAAQQPPAATAPGPAVSRTPRSTPGSPEDQSARDVENPPTAAIPEPEPPVEEVKAEKTPGIMLHDEWLPRLKLPPSLEPFDDLPFADTGASTSETPFTSTPAIQDDELVQPFRAEHSPLDDDLPPDAGLGDLLARALAEHQAGTSSAAALVKRFGGQNSGETRTVNGHGRNGDSPSNGRHRGDS